MTAAAVARPMGMEVATARCRNGAEWRQQKEINKRAKAVIRARQKKADEDAAARAAHNGEVVRQSAAGAAEKKRKRKAEKNKRQRKKKQVQKIHKEWQKEAEDDEWAAQSNAVVEEEAVLVAVQWRTRQAVRALRAVRWQQQMQKLSEWKAEQFGGVRVQLGKSWCVWRQRCSAPDTSVSGDQKMSLTEETAEEDAEADNWAEVMAAVGMAANTANNRAEAGAVQAENPLFQSMEVDEAAAVATTHTEQTMELIGHTEGAAGAETIVTEQNPLFQSMGAEEAAMAVANRVEEVVAVEIRATVMAAVANATADTTGNATVAATVQDTAQESTEEQATEEQATATAQDTAQEETVFGGGASSSQMQAQSRVFDPGIINSFDIFPNLTATNFKICREGKRARYYMV